MLPTSLPDEKVKSLRAFALTIAPALYTAYYGGSEEVERFISAAMVHWLVVWPEEITIKESDNIKLLQTAQSDLWKRIRHIRQLLKSELNWKAWHYHTEEYSQEDDLFASMPWRGAMEQLLREDSQWQSYKKKLEGP
ncbi:hypothetical protein E1B28_013084 [Marasmius oreades]|uniref:Uncharacterized protein n=1 Tax=Marasmius oreades TaxID=181124 RepID=A0A9P7RQ90_9AGAR|nr:uncharacterized protein E1B28_013084 [Marasmius oreades]KAG7087103.1 hypothetical protein E1B28_013084 [Marasmius oreades]